MVGLQSETILSAAEIQKAILRLSNEIFSDAQEHVTSPLVLVGIATGGVPLARRLFAHLQARRPEVYLGELDITFYRDDISWSKKTPVVKNTDIPVSLDGAYAVLVDDVLFSGRTVRAAMDALVDFGRPERVRLCVLVDRGHRELPIHADFVGRKVETNRKDRVEAHFTDLGMPQDEVNILQREAR